MQSGDFLAMPEKSFNAKFDSSDFRSTLPRFTPDALKGESGAH